MKRSVALVAAGLAALAIGCGSDDDSSTSGSTGASGTEASTQSAAADGGSAAASKEPLKIGSIITETGTFASSNGPAALGLKAWAEYVNKNGGINGRPVELTIKDDKNDPSVALAAMKEFAADEDIVAVVGSVSAVEETWAPVAAQAKLPVVGDFPHTPASYTTEYVFPQGTTVGTTNYAQAYAAIKLAEAPKVAVMYCAEVPSCAEIPKIIEPAAEELGGELVNAQGVPATAPNYDAQCSAAQKAGADAVIMALGVGTIISMAQSCESIGYTPKYIVQTTSLTPEEGDISAMADSTYGVVQTFPWVADSTPAQRAFQEGIKAANVPAKKLGAAVSLAWTAGALFEEAVKRIDGEVTRESLAESLWNLPPDTTLDGLAPPLNYKANAPSPEVKCFFAMKLSGGEWTAPWDEPFCQE